MVPIKTDQPYNFVNTFFKENLTQTIIPKECQLDQINRDRNLDYAETNL
ncbi:hypothetical protein LLG10_05760 [bacterium]|nr:hypothetical protein [bacterium]